MFLESMSSSDIILLASYIAINISKDLSSDEITILSNFLMTIADNLSIIATKKQNN